MSADPLSRLKEEFPGVCDLLVAVVASECSWLRSGIGQPDPVPGETEDFPLLCSLTRKCVDDEYLRRRDKDGESLASEFPEVHELLIGHIRTAVSRTKGSGPRIADPLSPPASQAAIAKETTSKETFLHSSPFHVLGASVRDGRKRIVELADERSLVADAELCAKARGDLTNPRNRLAAEIAWLPGLSPNAAKVLIESLPNHTEMLRRVASAPALAKANLMAAAIGFLDPATPSEEWRDWIVTFAEAVDEIDPGDVMRTVNEDRSVSGFPEIRVLDLVEAELSERRRVYTDTVRDALNELPPNKLVEVVTKVVELTTDSGEKHAPALVHEVVERYEAEANRFLVPEAENIKKLIEALVTDAAKGEAAVKPLVARLESMLKRWDSVAQPVQLSMKAQGLDHDLSGELAWGVRQLSVDLFNRHGMLETASRLNGLLREVFAELPEVVVRLEEDSDALEDIHEKHREAKKRDAEWEREITFSAELGLVFKDRLEISPRGVSWRGETIPLDEVTRVRWGAVRKSVNGVPTGTDHTIAFGDRRRELVIETGKTSIAEAFVERLWNAVGVRILNESLLRLKEGGKLTFGSVVVEDDGVHLKKKSFLSIEAAYRRWNQVKYYSSNGSLVLVDKDDQKVSGSMSYMEVPNVHVLEAIIRLSFQKWRGRLSGLLDD